MSTTTSDPELDALAKELGPEAVATLVEGLSHYDIFDSLAYCNISLNPRQAQAWADFAIALSETHSAIQMNASSYGNIEAIKPLAERTRTALRRENERRKESAE